VQRIKLQSVSKRLNPFLVPQPAVREKTATDREGLFFFSNYNKVALTTADLAKVM